VVDFPALLGRSVVLEAIEEYPATFAVISERQSKQINDPHLNELRRRAIMALTTELIPAMTHDPHARISFDLDQQLSRWSAPRSANIALTAVSEAGTSRAKAFARLVLRSEERIQRSPAGQVLLTVRLHVESAEQF
jgi:hypothetical protein